MKSPIRFLKYGWEKNWPEIHSALTGGLPRFILAQRPKDTGSNVPVFCYHVVDEEAFRTDLDFLSRNGYVTIDADALLDHVEGRTRAPERSVVLTIDDGARNLYEVAFPSLKHYGMKAVAFIIPGFHKNDSEKEPRPHASDSSLRPLTWSEIREMNDSGLIDIQSHTYEHRYLPRWPESAFPTGWSEKEVSSLLGPGLSIEEDFKLSRQILEERLNKKIRHLAFPRYDGTAEALRIGQKCGYNGFWWGVLPHRPGNQPGDSPTHIVRLNGEFVRRLPGDKRVTWREIARMRYGGTGARLFSDSR